ncbi:cyclase family protein [Tamlana sp. 2201CG12-4]|uniref:cyclase family protein n=1 Tax=Tamlana sp. 2201CG12-4 TaxID=3112582 RepID=UPI002DC05DDF|nr:cyclase family protein [Tamlana sp. 2201CG12-4]MEC3908706.1 cyclase family protein [Tamlana sp. 2201CG12-4]
MRLIKNGILLSVFAFIACQNNTEKNNVSDSVNTIFEYNQIIDLTHEFSKETIYWVTAKEFEMDVVAHGETEKGFFYAANNFSTAEHGGTHVDAPIHFARHGQTLDQIPVENLIGKAIKVDVSERAMNNPEYLVSIEDLLNWEKENNTQIPDRSIVLLETGFSRYYPDKVKYLGTDMRGEEAVKELHFPGLDPKAASWLVKNRTISSIGIDTPSIDYGQSSDFESHVILLGENIPAFENLTNLDKLPANDFTIVALPMKIKGGSGGPLRIIALIK